MNDIVKLKNSGKSFSEIAALLGVSKTTAHRRYEKLTASPEQKQAISLKNSNRLKAYRAHKKAETTRLAKQKIFKAIQQKQKVIDARNKELDSVAKYVKQPERIDHQKLARELVIKIDSGFYDGKPRRLLEALRTFNHEPLRGALKKKITLIASNARHESRESFEKLKEAPKYPRVNHTDKIYKPFRGTESSSTIDL